MKIIILDLNPARIELAFSVIYMFNKKFFMKDQEKYISVDHNIRFRSNFELNFRTVASVARRTHNMLRQAIFDWNCILHQLI